MGVFVELPIRASWLRQAEDRLHRRGQQHSVNIYYLVLPHGSHDDKHWMKMSQKMIIVSALTFSNV
jgi:hypothetical protein